MDKECIIIGAGIAGLAASIRLANKGYSVHVYEKNSNAGGKLRNFTLGKYRFDFGPSLFTMPDYVTELFTISNKDVASYFQFISTDEACRYFYPDSTRFIAAVDEEEFIQRAIETFEVDAKDLRAYMDENLKIFENAGQIFLTKSIHKFETWLSPKVLKSLFHSYVLNMLKSMHYVTEKKLKNEKLVQLFDRYATYNGSSPYLASSILNSISSLEHNYGTYFPKGGMISITNALEQLAIDSGVNFHYNQPVEKIIVKSRKATGIKTKDQDITADIVVSNMDVSFTYDKLLGKEKFQTREKSSSAIIFYWGIKSTFPELGLHNIFFSDDYKKEFDEIFDKKQVPSNPTIYINISSKHNQDDAPEGCENWFVMINTPADFGQDWDEEIEKLRQVVIKSLSDHLQTDIRELIEEERVVDPRTIEEETLSHKGALYGTSSNHWLSAFLRHPNFSNEIKNLYFVGGSVHPGGGIPLCLLSAKIASELID